MPAVRRNYLALAASRRFATRSPVLSAHRLLLLQGFFDLVKFLR